MNTSKSITAIVLIAGIAGAGWWLSSPKAGDPGSPAQQETAAIAQGAPMVEVRLPDSLSGRAQIGQRAFEVTCAVCHSGNAAAREGIAPPLVHRIYEPGHHADEAFQRAVQYGVRAHHWEFGNMPPVEGVTRADVMAITVYIRELQRANGIN
ncbi:MAG: c-type cytochrome [Roseicyclus sp.]|nr:c-type cytochrome [Roseicyclus sp.]MBO6922487.1 c-type cytochrome [Roseicyclus sp.]